MTTKKKYKSSLQLPRYFGETKGTPSYLLCEEICKFVNKSI